MTTARAGNGKFVAKSNPIAVMAITVANAKREAAARERAERRARRANGYHGPLTRADLAKR